MSMFYEFASEDDLKEYLGSETLPDSSKVMINRANELVSMAIKRNYNPDDEEHNEVAKKAVCAQCQNWIENKLSPVSDMSVSGYSLGDLSVTFSDSSKQSSNTLCSAAVHYLNLKHLLYKGLEGRSCGCQAI